MNIVAILAGGNGRRIGGDIPKQFLQIAGKSVIEYSMEAFQKHSDIDEIVLVVPSTYISKCKIYQYIYPKISAIIQGGDERYLSTLAVLNHYSKKNEDILILHDAARPMINKKMIDRMLISLKTYNAAIVAVKSTDTIVQSHDKKVINAIFDRSSLFNVQTPQAFTFSVLRKAFELALQDKGFNATDDSAIVFNYLPNEPVAIIEGSTLNIKLTYPEDFLFLEKYIQSKNENS